MGKQFARGSAGLNAFNIGDNSSGPRVLRLQMGTWGLETFQGPSEVAQGLAGTERHTQDTSLRPCEKPPVGPGPTKPGMCIYTCSPCTEQVPEGRTPVYQCFSPGSEERTGDFILRFIRIRCLYQFHDRNQTVTFKNTMREVCVAVWERIYYHLLNGTNRITKCIHRWLLFGFGRM